MSLEPAEQLVHDGAYFLIGAGASRHLTLDTSRVDFPLGVDLLENFSMEIVNSERVYSEPLPAEQKFWFEKNKNSYNSIDSVLHAAHEEGFKEIIDIGRGFVDRFISEAEAKALKNRGQFVVPWVKRLLDFTTKDARCYEHARDRITPPYENSNELTFHTLNYDRVVEFSFLNYLIDRFRNERGEIENDLDNEMVRHLHGSLGTLKERPFGEPLKAESSTIRFWFEKSSSPHSWSIQNRLIDLRKNCVFLGFGFHEQITSRIAVPNRPVKFYVNDFKGSEKSKVKKFLSSLRACAAVPTKDYSHEVIDALVADYETIANDRHLNR
jgi:hypothetical protein